MVVTWPAGTLVIAVLGILTTGVQGGSDLPTGRVYSHRHSGNLPPGWSVGSRAHPNSPVGFTLRLRLGDNSARDLSRALELISDPKAPRASGDGEKHLSHLSYGRHLSRAEADSLLRPVDGAFETVERWLVDHGFDIGDSDGGYGGVGGVGGVGGDGVGGGSYRRSQPTSSLGVGHCRRTGDGVACRSTASTAEALFSTRLHEYDHPGIASVVSGGKNGYGNGGGERRRRPVRHIGRLRVPEHVEPYVALVTGLSELGDPREYRLALRMARGGAQARLVGPHDAGGDIDLGGDGAGTGIAPVTPADLRLYHGVPAALSSRNPLNRQAAASFGSTFSPRSLAAFQSALGLEPHNVSLIVSAASEHGGNNGDGENNNNNNNKTRASTVRSGSGQGTLPVSAEADLDVQYLTAMSEGTETWFFEQSGADWLLALLDDVDARGQPPWVLAISYGWPERTACSSGLGASEECSRFGYSSREYVDRVNTVLQKLGARGVTVVAASGDAGSAGDSGNCPKRDLRLSPGSGVPNVTGDGTRLPPPNRCPQVKITKGQLSCAFPSSSPACAALSLDADCQGALSSLAAAAVQANCDTSAVPGQGGGDSYFYSACECSKVFSAVQGGAVQRGRCLAQPYAYDIASGSPLEPVFPASSPYVLAVGGVVMARGNGGTACEISGVLCPRSETVASASLDGVTVTSGGGFAAFSEAPAWQRKEIDDYVAAASGSPVFPPKESFDPTRRGYPDVSSIAAGCLVSTGSAGGQLTRVDGTSCATPTIAGLISLLNAQLLDRGLAPLGFANPVFYSAARSRPGAFRDATRGDTRCGRTPITTTSASGPSADDGLTTGAGSVCCDYGWPAVRGWDPATGLGSPVFEELRHHVLLLAAGGKTSSSVVTTNTGAGGAAGTAGVIGASTGASDPYLTTPIVVGVGILCMFLAMIPGAVFAALAGWIAGLVASAAGFSGLGRKVGEFVQAPRAEEGKGRSRKIRKRINVPDFDESGENETGVTFRTPSTSAVLE